MHSLRRCFVSNVHHSVRLELVSAHGDAAQRADLSCTGRLPDQRLPA